jgi:hypothetical protein
MRVRKAFSLALVIKPPSDRNLTRMAERSLIEQTALVAGAPFSREGGKQWN